MDSGDGSAPKRRTRQQSLKYMVELIQRNRLSRSGNPTSSVNANSGRKRKMAEPSRGDERKNDDSPEEESRPDVISIEEEIADSKSSSESESEASTDENKDEPNDKTYQEIESPASDSEESEPRSLVPQLVVEDEEQDKGEEELESSSEEDCVVNDSETQKKTLHESAFLKFVVDSIINGDDCDKVIPPKEKERIPVKETLSLIFRFEDEEPLPPEKEDREKEMDNIFDEMDMCESESNIGFTNSSVLPMQSRQTCGCQAGNQRLFLDEQIGLICKVCSHVVLENMYIFPPFAQRSPRGYGSKYFEESSSLLNVDSFRFSDSSVVQDSPIYGEGTVWDLVPLSIRATMYPHQRGGFEFMCLLLNWEAEFQKWEADIPFHNLNSKDLSFREDEGTVGVFNCLSRAARKDPNLIRILKLRSWAKSKSILGISYDMFRILTREDGKKNSYAKETREILLKFPGLLVLKEGNTARNEQRLVWKALKEVETKKRIVLSGTPFQNNIKELYNTLCVVSPKFAGDMEQKWVSLSSSLEKNARALEELRDIISPLVHSCSKNVKRVSLPGIRDTVVHLKPTYLQKELLKRITENLGSFYEQNLASLISVHPSLVAKRKEFSEFESRLKEIRCWLDPDIGVKMKFVVELIRLCGGTKERVIIFSQLLDPLNLIKEQLKSLFGWTFGREILYMDGKLDVKQRQISINSLNDPKSDVKVLLASTKAYSEGISLIGASRVVLLDVLWNPSVEQQAISLAYRIGQKKTVHVYCPVTSKWEVDKIEQQVRKRYHSDVLLSRNEVNTSCSASEDDILESMVKHEGLRHIFERLSHAPRVVPTTCFNSFNHPSKPST
ncbi:hypothetical protein CQW23_01261 [Capsicum baccatum]|uniref:Helicase C-terminal domain-containing protein n=1 Tax=Capsicum baccatum TaxID=33114 RepID=A0A2G2XN35_CAPBA|nr:hypothetical protein CQW23_01261 [Capsicum baccatum]